MVKPSLGDTEFRRFVVLQHTDGDGVHFDLMIDQGQALATWKFNRPPESADEHPLAGSRIGDHRRVYLNYEGPISGNRGSVARYDEGDVELRGARDDVWRAAFRGRRLAGDFVLERVAPGDQSWSLRREDARRPSG